MLFQNSLLIAEANPVKPRITEDITTFQIKQIRSLTYVNQFYKV